MKCIERLILELGHVVSILIRHINPPFYGSRYESKAIIKPSPLLDRKIEEICAGLVASAKNLHSISEDNATTIVKYIGVMNVAASLNRRFIGIEINSERFDLAKARLTRIRIGVSENTS